MCGLSGIVNKDGSPVCREEISMMNNLIIHRGPDSDGFFLDNNLGLGHRRLSIIDLSENGRQPMSFKNKYTLIFNGEIYNYREIKIKLEKVGYIFKSQSDTEIILAAYDFFGMDCVKHFNGMWAFALHDSMKKILFCSRDRFGVKPFYYSDSEKKFVFGSELKQLIPFQNCTKVNIPILTDYLVGGYEDHTNDTFFQNISKLEQSHNLIYDLKSNTKTIYRYYDLKIDNSLCLLNEEESIVQFKQMLTDSITLRLRSDVTVGTCLSGGLDSSSIASLAAEMYNKKTGNKFNSITAKAEDHLLDESSYAEKVVHKAGLKWSLVKPSSEGFFGDLSKIISIQEEPFGSPSVYMQYKVFEKARQDKCVVMLDGQGGDEVLLGYERYLTAYILSLGKLNRIDGLFSAFNNSGLPFHKLISYLIYFTNASLRLKILRKKNSFIKNVVFDQLNRDVIEASSRSFTEIVEMQKLEICKVQLPHLLKYEDRNSMYHSIESRLPFLDYRFVELALSLNNKFKIKNGWTKYLLRMSMQGIMPPEVTWRKDKLGFNAPESLWLKPILPSLKKQVMKSELINYAANTKTLDNIYNKLDVRTQWRMYNAAKWEELFNVSI